MIPNPQQYHMTRLRRVPSAAHSPSDLQVRLGAARVTQTSPRALQEEPHDLSRNTFRLVQPDREYAVGSAPASRSFVLAALRALHLDPRTTAPTATTNG